MVKAHGHSGFYRGAYDEERIREWAEGVRGGLEAPEVSLGLVFLSPSLMEQAEQVLELVRLHARVTLLVGCTSTGLIVGGEELEDVGGIALGLYWLPGADLRVCRFTQEQVEVADGPGYWHGETGVGEGESRGWLVFADPFHLDAERWLGAWSEAYAGVPVLGGLAGGDFAARRTQVFWDGEIFEEGGVALSVGGGVRLASVISQGCSPIGETWTVTRAERNWIHQIGNRPAYEVLMETYGGLTAEEQERAQGNLFLGLVMNEYLEEFGRGDFLIRNLLGADPRVGSIAVGALPRAGQTVQFQRRDPESASEDLRAALGGAVAGLGEGKVYGGCLCSCNGRGQRMFGKAGHDAGMVQEELGVPGLAGFFCSGELGPVGGRNYLHGFTASLALFVGDGEGEVRGE